jgi:hypothetical protein
MHYSRGEAREYGRIADTPAALRRLVGKLGQEAVEIESRSMPVLPKTPIFPPFPVILQRGLV